MSNPGIQDAAASALQGGPQQPGGGQQQPQGNKGGLGELAQAYARCEQTQSCTPQDAEILAAGLPQLMKMAENIKMILDHVQKSQGQPQQVR